MTPEEERKDRMQDYLVCFSSPSGKRVLNDFRKAYGDRTSFANDALVMAHNEGRRSVYLSILYLMEQARKERQEEKQAKAETG